MKKEVRGSYERRTHDIIASLTLEEKLRMLSTHHNAADHPGLGEYYIGTEVARGYVGRDTDHISTVFPQPTGLAGTFDKELMGKLGEIAANEARAYYNEKKQGGISLWGPTVDMARDPRWGRNEEAYGEDPCLTGEMAAAYTKSMEGDNGEFVKTIPTLKHFCANNNEENRDRCDAYLPLRLKYEYYYAPFEYAVRRGGAKSLMTAYNEINGCPAILNPDLKTIIKDKWGLWYTVSDGGDLSQTVTSHRYVDSHSLSFALSVKAGSDTMTDREDMVYAAAKKALEKGEITEEEIDETLFNTLFSRFALGQFDDCPYDLIDKSVIDCEEYRKTNLRAALEQMVLLKNEGILPIKGSPSRIAVAGPMADENLMDWYTGYSSGDVSVRAGIEAKYPCSTVIHDSLWDIVSVKAPNGKYLSVKEDGSVCADAETVTGSELFELQDWGENWNNLFSVKYRKYVKLCDDGSFRLNNRRIYDWFTRETLNLKNYCGKILIEEYLHHRRMTCSEKGEIGVRKITNVTPDQLFCIEVIESGKSRAEKIAQSCDLVIYCVGNYPVQTAKEGYDRKTLDLNIRSGMAEHICGINRNTVMMIISSYPYAINEEKEKLPAIIYSTHAGPHLGTAAAAVISGEYSPAGRLAQTWYRSENDLPDILNYDIETSRTTYMYFEGTPLFPFGYGLSYAEFEYSDFTVMEENGRIYADITVKNLSERESDEVVQIYFTVKASQVSRPRKKLCAFAREHFDAGEQRRLRIEICRDNLRIFNVRNREMMIESADYTFLAAASSEDIRAESQLFIKGGEMGTRACRFDAECFDSADNMRISYSRRLERHYIIATSWEGSAKYSGIDFEGKKKLSISASSVMGTGHMRISFGDDLTLEGEIIPSDSYDDFMEYSFDIPDTAGDTVIISITENACVLEIGLT